MNEPCLPCKPVIPELQVIRLIDRRVRSIIFDYALGALILGVIPLYGVWVPPLRVACLILLNLKMVISVGHYWGYHNGRFILTYLTVILTILRSFLLAMLVWVGVLLVGLFIPYADSLARAVAYGFLTVSIGNYLSHYFYRPGILDGEALGRAMKFNQLHLD